MNAIILPTELAYPLNFIDLTASTTASIETSDAFKFPKTVGSPVKIK